MAINCTNCGTPLTPQQAGEPCPACGSMDRNITAEERAVASAKARVARELANRHFQVDPGMKKVFRFSGSAQIELQPAEPIKMLEVNEETVPAGILPLRFGPVPDSGIHFPSIIVEVTPDEYEQIRNKQLELPKGWDTADELPKPAALDGGA